jgi:tetratricopeptide (TPR) repeat protein
VFACSQPSSDQVAWLVRPRFKAEIAFIRPCLWYMFFWTGYNYTGDASLLSKAANSARQYAKSCPPGHAARAASCGALALCLKTRHLRNSDPGLLTEAIELEREALMLRPLGDPYHAELCGNLAISLKMRYDLIGDVGLFVEAIDLMRRALSAYPSGHADRVVACMNLAVFLRIRYNQTSDTSLLAESIGLAREALSSHNTWRFDRASVRISLAGSLKSLYDQTSDDTLLTEAIDLLRQCLTLRRPPLSDIDRAICCANLGSFLKLRYHQTSDVGVLVEAIEFERESLASQPPGYTDRAIASVNIAVSLMTYYMHTGNAGLLDEAIALTREALALSGPGNIHRGASCAHLALCLNARYHLTGDTDLLIEAISLQREALALRPPDHSDRMTACTNLANSLRMRGGGTGDHSLLTEAISLEREALALCPPGHHHRGMTCINLAISLGYCAIVTGDRGLLGEAIDLLRHALAVLSSSSAQGVLARNELAEYLISCYEETSDLSVISEALRLSQESLSYSPPWKAWKSLRVQCMTYLAQHASSESAVSNALRCLIEWSESEADDMRSFMTNICPILEYFWGFHITRTDDMPTSLVSVYSNIIDRLPLMAAFVLSTSSRLTALRNFSQLGLQACVVALKAERLPRAIELLDHAHGVIWAQALHQRDPQLAGVPSELASELQILLRAIASPIPPDSQLLSERHITPYDLRHKQNGRIQTILGQIRAIPGLGRFMRGSTFETLREVACTHPVVVLVAVHDQSYALIISSSSQDEPSVLKLDVTSERMVQLRGYTRRAGDQTRAPHEANWRDAWSEPVEDTKDSEDSERLMRPADPSQHSLDGVLRTVWKVIVKPVLDHLGIQVSDHVCTNTACPNLIVFSADGGTSTTAAALVPDGSFCVSPHPCSWNLCRSESRVLG